jgi:hypothetical protein
MLASVPARTILEWQAYYQLEPFGESRADLRNAMLCSLVANIMRGKDSEPVQLDDFMPTFDGTKRPQRAVREQTPEEQFGIMTGLFGTGAE